MVVACCVIVACAFIIAVLADALRSLFRSLTWQLARRALRKADYEMSGIFWTLATLAVLGFMAATDRDFWPHLVITVVLGAAIMIGGRVLAG